MRFDQSVLDGFLDHLAQSDKSAATAEKYGRALRGLLDYARTEGLTGLDGPALRAYRKYLSGRLSPASANASISAVNKFLAWSGRPDLKLNYFRIQRRAFRDPSEDLTRDDYRNLVDAAYRLGRDRLGLVLETFGSTGIRASELDYITAEAVNAGMATVRLKGKVRTVLLPTRLRDKLLEWCRSQGIRSGPAFRTRTGGRLTRQEVWREMKGLCRICDIPESKAYPHNLRHMFATEFYAQTRDLAKLADVLGHSSVETTRIYLITSGAEHARQLDLLDLVR